jgi:hypothetical protein
MELSNEQYSNIINELNRLHNENLFLQNAIKKLLKVLRDKK